MLHTDVIKISIYEWRLFIMAIKFANRMDQLKSSEIRELLKLSMKPGIISFAGGLPAPELFPIEEMKTVAVKVLNESGEQALQYNPTEGFDPLREKIANRMKSFGVETTKDNILITSGSQQGLDFSGKIFINPGDYVVIESPSYLGALNAFMSYEGRFIDVETDQDGMVIEDLVRKLENNENIKMIYVIPDFQNPSGRTWSLERRKQLLEVAKRFDLPIIEDCPYGELRFEGEAVPSIKSMDDEGRVIFLGSFSKTFSPGLRIGWVCADEEMLLKYVTVKQSADLQASSISQRELDMFLEMYDFDAHIEKIRETYKQRRTLICSMMEEYFPKAVTFTFPEGGLFTWAELPAFINGKELLFKAVEKDVAFVPGGSFFPNGGHENTMRINYSNMTEDKIIEGIKRLGTVLYEVIADYEQSKG